MEDITLRINETDYPVHYDKSEYGKVFIAGKPFEIELLKKFGDDVFSFAVNQRLYQVDFDFDENDNLQISLNGMVYDIEISTDTKKMLSKYISESGIGKVKSGGIIKAPMPGLVIKILVEEGMSVMAGDKLIIVEAMKMENILKSTINGTIKKIHAKEGQAVDKDAILIEIV